MLTGKKIILGVSGSIAAYKSAQLIRLLAREGAEVKVVMTPHAKEFITPLTLATLSKNPVLCDFFTVENGSWNNHIDLSSWADAYLIAPTTASTIAKLANGNADNLLLATYLASHCPVFVAPAMDSQMYEHPTMQNNLKKLAQAGNIIIEPLNGELIGGVHGKGKMQEPESIIYTLKSFFEPKDMKGKKILITAGPTFERIDSVRFVGNYSSGKTGFALAEVCAAHGAEVTLVSGPVSLTLRNNNIKRIYVENAEQMYKATMSCFQQMDGAILSAAVSDFTPTTVATAKKIKQGTENLTLEFKPTRDIAAALGKIKNPEQFLTGFAIETDNAELNAIEKMNRKNFDFIVLNRLGDIHANYGFDSIKYSIIHRSGLKKDYELKSKHDIAIEIVKEINTLIF
ncbi:MAG: bifunctional phosphopantothenoylcysteine decarboxylase/phosphopantothenate--cysteine ligase CoaBC [Paludibacter sp.]|jgi:phosphopantothenoylcysteine decarboxylase/phosphopantothenate--cysteine ligase|nr:bifunctional phosphopantothenoylcysteine decarboxylase/phosphopantothenate--cysteine ligase CoaBC [Paludibacter sp.]